MAAPASSYGFLQSLKLGDWHPPRDILKTAETTEQQRMSSDSVSQWAQACIHADAIIGAGRGPYGTETTRDLGMPISSEALREAYTGFCKQNSLRPLGTDGFGKACADMFGPRKRLPRRSKPTRQAIASAARGAIDVPDGAQVAGEGRCAPRHQEVNRRSSPACHSAGAAVPRCLTFQQQVGQRKVCADWAFVSGVSPVSPNLKLIDRIQSGIGTGGISRRQALCAGTGGTSATVTRFSGETTGLRHTWDSWDTSKRGQGARSATFKPCDHFVVGGLAGSTI